MVSKLKKLVALVLVFITALTPIACKKDAYVTRSEKVFSSDILMTVSAYGLKSSDLDEIYDFASELNSLINPQIPTSQIATFNAMQTGELKVDEHVFILVREAKRVWNESNGAFDVSLSSLSKLWKVDNEYIFKSHEHDLPTQDQLDGMSSTMAGVELREQSDGYYLVKTNPSTTLDLGGIAKGYLCDEIAKMLKNKNCNSALVDVGGNLLLLGLHEADSKAEKWRVSVKSPTNAGILCGIKVENSSVVTSGTYERYYEKNNVKYCHIINPQTKMPIGVTKDDQGYKNEPSYVISCSVWGLSGTDCDALATAVCVLGLERGKELLEAKNATAIIVTSDGKYALVGNVDFMDGYEVKGLERA